MLLMVEKGILGGITDAIHRYTKANNKYMKNYYKNKELSYLIYLDANNLYGCAILQKLLVVGFKLKKNILKFNEKFIKNCNEDSYKGYIFEVDVEYPKELFFNKHKDLSFLPEKMKTKLIGPEKRVCNIHNKKNYVVHIRALKQASNYRLMLKKVHNVIEFNQKAWLKPYIEMNTKIRKNAKNDF